MNDRERSMMRDASILTAALFTFASANPWIDVNLVPLCGGYVIGVLGWYYLGGGGR